MALLHRHRSGFTRSWNSWSLKMGSTPPLSNAYGGGFGKTPRRLGEKKHTNNASKSI
mgnify:FL=1|jgi:hypothetical protein